MNTTLTMSRAIGWAVLATGVLLLVFAINASGSPAEQLSETLTGRYTNGTVWYLVGAIAGLVAGGTLVLSGK